MKPECDCGLCRKRAAASADGRCYDCEQDYECNVHCCYEHLEDQPCGTCRVAADSAAIANGGGQPCGLNADWCITAYYFGCCGGIDRGPNRTDGGLYILDTELEDQWELVQRFYREDGNDKCVPLACGTVKECLAALEEHRETVKRTLDAAERGFWRAIARAYPAIKTGDFPPNAAAGLRTAMRDALGTWVCGNQPL